MCLSVCLCLLKDFANYWTDVVLLYGSQNVASQNVASQRSWEGL